MTAKYEARTGPLQPRHEEARGALHKGLDSFLDAHDSLAVVGLQVDLERFAGRPISRAVAREALRTLLGFFSSLAELDKRARLAEGEGSEADDGVDQSGPASTEGKDP